MMFCADRDRAQDDGYDYFCPVLHTKADVQMIGIARLHWRPTQRACYLAGK